MSRQLLTKQALEPKGMRASTRKNAGSRSVRLAHQWELVASQEATRLLVHEFIRPAVQAVPAKMAGQIGPCRIRLAASLGGPDVASEWTTAEEALRISIATTGRDAHDIAMELLVCLGQALWQKLTSSQLKAYWQLLDSEFQAGVGGEIDEDAVREKRALLAGRISAASGRRLERYGRASFAGSVAEYVHCLWHDVEVVSGPQHLPAEQLRRRLKLLANWFPPSRGRKLFAARKVDTGS